MSDSQKKESQKVEELDQEVEDLELEDQVQDAEEVQEEDSTDHDEVEALKEEVEALEDQKLRLQAEIQNMRRINQRDRQEAAKYRSQSLASELVEALDNMERALEAEVTSSEAQSLKEGVEMVYQQILTAFESEKIKQTNPLGEEFDPNFEQAVSVMPKEEGQEAGLVVNVLQKGYVLDDRVIRPAMVIVSE